VKQLFLLAVLAAVALTPALSQKGANSPFGGRWDLTVTTANDIYPSWIELSERNGTPQVRVVGRVASVHPAQNVKVAGDTLSFTTSEWLGKPTKVSWELIASSGRLSGALKREDGIQGKIAGVPAPALNRQAPSAWTKPEALFNGKDLTGWEPLDNPSQNHWTAQNGELLNEKAGANIRTRRTFNDFKLHIEYNCPKNGNSGVYLRGRYEVQVEYEPPGTDDIYHGMGSIYGFLAPSKPIAPRPGQWESYDITLIGRTVTVARDGIVTIDHQEISGITGGAIDSNEGQPGPIYLQGDHTGGMKYRNIMISVPQS
jgi:hypothetical protein